MSTAQTLLTLFGLVLVTVLTRGFFTLPSRDLPSRDLPLPDWLRASMRYALTGALVAVVAPELLMSQGQRVSTWQDARLLGAAAATAWFVWRRGMMGTILVGTGAVLVLHLGLGW